MNGWRDAARCAGEDPDMFFGRPGDPGRAAKRVCAACPVARECLEFALRTNQQYGIWGGANIDERRKMDRPEPAGPELCTKQLHVMDDQNTHTYAHPNGKTYRRCRACARARDAATRAAERARLTGSPVAHSGIGLEKRKNFATITAELQSEAKNRAAIPVHMDRPSDVYRDVRARRDRLRASRKSRCRPRESGRGVRLAGGKRLAARL